MPWNRETCSPNTRVHVLNFVSEWLTGDASHEKPVLWLHGLAGSGKSTIAATVAQNMRNLHRLGAYFCFDRGIPERKAADLITTLVYKLAKSNNNINAKICSVVEQNPDIESMSLEYQFSTLLSATSLNVVDWYGGPLVIVIDALDECGSEEDRRLLMKALPRGLSELPPFIRVIIVSRPEADIQRVLQTHPSVFPYAMDIDSGDNRSDIVIYLRHRFSEIAPSSGDGSTWPGPENIESLARQAAGLFIWATTACKYIATYEPETRLRELLGHATANTTSTPFDRLDTLYEIALKSSCNWADNSLARDCCNLFGLILCARVPLSCPAIDTLLDIRTARILSSSGLGCVLRWSETEPVRTLHPTFREYLSSPIRCGGQRWFIDLQEHNRRVAIRCLDLLGAKLKVNIGELSLNQRDWEPLLPEALTYACRHWINHITMIVTPEPNIMERIQVFAETHLLHWIEAMAFLKENAVTIRLLGILLKWLKVC